MWKRLICFVMGMVVCLASDAVPLYECIEGLEQGKYGLSSLCADLEAFYHTFDRLRELQEKEGVKIIASHDFLTLKDGSGK